MHGNRWTASKVEAELVATFREWPGTAIWSPAENDLRPAGGKVAGLDLVMATARILGRQSVERMALLTWARCVAAGQSFAPVCREMGWPAQTARERRQRGAEHMAETLNAEFCMRSGLVA